jgi:hypothetical protein
MDRLSQSLMFASASQAADELQIGDPYEGGYFGGQINVSGTIYNLVVAPKSSGESSAVLKYKTTGTADSPSAIAQNVEYGKLATDQFNDAAHPIFQWAKGLTIAGHTDWYVPAKNELEILYRNLKPDATANYTFSGANANAVPSATSNYTASVPGQTTAALFQSGGAQAFAFSSYWTSTEYAPVPSVAWYQRFNNGNQSAESKNGTTIYYVRAIRRVAAP